MIFTKIALVLGVLVLGFVVWLALVGVHAVGEGLVTLVVLVLLVGGGNLLGGRHSYGARRTADVEPRPLSDWRPPVASARAVAADPDAAPAGAADASHAEEPDAPPPPPGADAGGRPAGADG
jgi:hypothetical protein